MVDVSAPPFWSKSFLRIRAPVVFGVANLKPSGAQSLCSFGREIIGYKSNDFGITLPEIFSVPFEYGREMQLPPPQVHEVLFFIPQKRPSLLSKLFL